jgi:hypothetical protein
MMKHMTKFDHAIGILGLALLVFAGFLAGCEPKVGGPELLTQCTFETPLTVSVIEYATEKELADKWEYYNRTKLPEGAEAKGFATYNLVTKTHTLHILKIRGQTDSDRIETLGHELMHSFCGAWHP